LTKEIIMRHPVVHFEIAGKNAEQLRRFYSLLFQWRMDPGAGDKYTDVHTETESGIDGNIFETLGDVPAHVTIYVEVDDAQDYLERGQLLGGEVVMPSTAIPGVGTIAVLRDPAGNSIGLLQNRGSAKEAKGYDARAA
jgi:predicted enzyme related to lactoylglutathione lyase